MSIRVSGRVFKGAVAVMGVAASASLLAGCSSLGSRAFGDPIVTGSTVTSAQGNLNQSMPATLQVAANSSAPYLPPANIGDAPVEQFNAANVGAAPLTGAATGNNVSVQSRDLPVLGSPSNAGSSQAMPAQPSLATATLPADSAVPVVAAPKAPATNLSVVPDNAYTHTIESGESLYAIARRYDVTTDSIMHANKISSPDKIFVGQRIVIPGRPEALAAKGPARQEVASIVPATAPVVEPAKALAEAKPDTTQTASAAPAQTAAPAAEKPAAADGKFRWPVSGRVITDFAGSKGTGINIEVAEGTAVRAVEKGTVIYTGAAIEGYGNLVLIKHDDGFVSAYAHLKSISVNKGDTISRGDAIGAAGMTGSVSKPQLHFELRKGATPIDPMPLLAS